MRIAIIGTGISGLSCAYKLNPQHDICLFEAAPKIGGHTATIEVHHEGEHHSIDTGFIVYNDWTYPNFIALLDELGVETQATDMSFSVSCSRSGVEYAGSNLNTLFAQRKNIVNPAFLRMIKDIIRFNKQAILDLESGKITANTTLGEYLAANNYSASFCDWYLIPMGSAIWSSSLDDMRQFPLMFFVRFFKNHGLLNIIDRPQWRVIKGGSKSYLAPLTAGFADKIRCNSSIAKIHRHERGASLTFQDGATEEFDQVILACHADEALALLADASAKEQTILKALPYKNNSVVLHTDLTLLPRLQKAWASWNYLVDDNTTKPPTLSYNMNILQGLSSRHTFVVSLNADEKINESKIIGRYNYAHPIFTLEGTRAQERKDEISGVNNTWYCGAYWRNGFHEDGCTSGLEVANKINALNVEQKR